MKILLGYVLLSSSSKRAFFSLGTFSQLTWFSLVQEIMQLFTIGLYLLNDDGTQRLDTQGVPLLSYTNFDITEYARVWTGFDWQARRGNTEESSSSKNRIDPMQIRIDWRDHLPKV